MQIYIDPGHGGSDSGAVGGGKTEKALALEIAKRLSEVLEANGIKAVLTRSTDADVTLASRCTSANNAAADCFVSIHLNSNAGTPASGVETLVYSTGTKAYSLAERVQNAVIAATGAVNRGVKLRPGLYVLRATHMPAVLVETGFINHDGDRAKLSDPGYQTTLAAAIARGVCDWAGIAFSDPGEEKPMPGDVDGDGKVTVADVVELRQKIVAGEYSPAGDLDGDGRNTAADVVALRQKIAKGEAGGSPSAELIPGYGSDPAAFIYAVSAASSETDKVKALQIALTLDGSAVTVDGKLGAKTEAAAKAHVLKNGSRGHCVVFVQRLLCPDAVDAAYGAKTAATVRAWQKAEGKAADGVVGVQTYRGLCLDRE